MDNDVAISVRGLSKSFKLPHEKKNSLKEHVLNFRRQSFEEFKALDDINFEIKKGEFFGIVGRNGSGKSTLLKILGGIYQPTAGEVKVKGSLTPFIELGIGFNPELTGRENVFLNSAILGITRKEVLQKYDEIVAFAELEKFMDQKLKNYSSGMQVRLAFSIAIQAHNAILLIDEVLAVGDSNFQRKCLQVFRDIKNSGKTIVFVTHDMGIVQEFCDRALMIQDSKVIDIGEPRKIALRYEQANRVTETPAPSAGADKKTTKLRRPENPDIKILDIKIKANGKPASNFSINDDITAEIKIDASRPVKFQINLFILRSNGAYLAGINSYRDLEAGAYLPTKGIQTLTCKILAGQLPAGEYGVGVGVYTPGYHPDLIDIIDKNYTTKVPHINIIDNSKYQDGDFYISGVWSKS